MASFELSLVQQGILGYRWNTVIIDEYAKIPSFGLSPVQQGIFNYLVYYYRCRDRFIGPEKPPDSLVSMIMIDYRITCISLLECKKRCYEIVKELHFHYEQDYMFTRKGQDDTCLMIHKFECALLYSLRKEKILIVCDMMLYLDDDVHPDWIRKIKERLY